MSGAYRAVTLTLALATLGLMVGNAAYAGASILIVNDDAPGIGFNDASPATPVGGNAGVTIGDQRMVVFERAAQLWGDILDSAVVIRVQGSFAPLDCSAGSAILGAAGPLTRHANFNGAAFGDTWYPQALANSVARFDQAGGVEDMVAFFNGDIDNNNSCLNGVNWYYGLDHNPPGSDVDFLNTIMHEMAHGMGFVGFVDLTNGEYTGFPDYPDIFARYTYDTDVGLHWDEMTAGQRETSATNSSDVVWDGPNVSVLANESLQAGLAGGFARLYTPSELRVGSSVYHFDTALSPNALMEPFITGSLQAGIWLDLTSAFMADIGWSIDDQDADFIADIHDNCSQVANPNQYDANGDGFGNICDADLTGDLVINFLDLGVMKAEFFSADANADLNGDGQVNFLDLGLMKSAFFGIPGPSGRAP